MSKDRNKQIINYLKNSIKKNKISHAYLFNGPDLPGEENEESEKIKTALWFAKTLQCKNNPKPCNKCRSCTDIEKNQHPDVMRISLLEDKNEILISQIRKLKKHLDLTPYNSSYKIAIIAAAHKMNKEAANALLKTLEEPKGNTVLILTTSAPSILLKTVISRCQEIKFKAPCLDKLSNNLINQEDLQILEKPLYNILNYIERTTRKTTINRQGKSNTLKLLDSWLFWFRNILIKNKSTKYSKQELIKIIQQVQQTKKIILNTNVNPRLALESLVLDIK